MKKPNKDHSLCIGKKAERTKGAAFAKGKCTEKRAVVLLTAAVALWLALNLFMRFRNLTDAGGDAIGFAHYHFAYTGDRIDSGAANFVCPVFL